MNEKKASVFIVHLVIYQHFKHKHKKKTHTPLSFSIENKIFTHYNKTFFMQIKIV